MLRRHDHLESYNHFHLIMHPLGIRIQLPFLKFIENMRLGGIVTDFVERWM